MSSACKRKTSSPVSLDRSQRNFGTLPSRELGETGVLSFAVDAVRPARVSSPLEPEAVQVPEAEASPLQRGACLRSACR